MTSTCHSKPCHMSDKSASSSSPLLSSSSSSCSSPSLTLNELSSGEFELLEMSTSSCFLFYPTAGSCWNECLSQDQDDSPRMSLNSLFNCPQYNYPVYLYHLLSSRVLLFLIRTLHLVLLLLLILLESSSNSRLIFPFVQVPH